MKIIGLSGSLRKMSFNTALLHNAAKLMPAGMSLEVRTLNDIPLFNEDVESTAFPASVTKLKDEIAAADGLLLATPEYNSAMPGVFKNAIDWMTRPSKDIARVFGKKKYAVIGASGGGFGTILAQDSWHSVMHHVGALRFSGKRIMVAKANSVFDATGNMTDEDTKKKLADFLEAFAGFVKG